MRVGGGMPGGRGAVFFFTVLVAVLLFVGQRLRPIPLPPILSVLLENPLTGMVVGPEKLVERLDLSPGMRVLDAGCGPGRLTVPAAKKVAPGGEVVALDSQEEMLGKLRLRLGRAGLTNARLMLGVLGAGDLEEKDVYDRVILAMALGEVRNRIQALREIHKALKPGGILSITEAIGDPDYRGRKTILTEAEAAGFEFLRQFGGRISFTANFRKPYRNAGGSSS